jgi:hypothetical protein
MNIKYQYMSFIHKIRVGIIIMGAACSMREEEARDIQGFGDKT